MAGGNGLLSSTRRGVGSSLNRTLLGCMFAVTLILLFQMTSDIPSSLLFTDYIARDESSLPSNLMTSATGWDAANPLGIPKGKAQNLPSIRIKDSEVDSKRKIYGGAGDAKHLGGFTEVDLDGISPDVWKHMVTKYGVKSVLDVGCGRGVSSLWFHLHGADILCVEGSHDAVERTMLPDPANQVVEHDFSRGPWWPEKTYSACWAVEFLEHVSLQYQFNFITAFRKCALIFATSSVWGGWHHVEVHSHDWWVQKFEAYGFRYSNSLTQEIRNVARMEQQKKILAPTGDKPYRAGHITLSMKVFINPAVAALPEHANLFPELGCFESNGPGYSINHKECGEGKGGDLETRLDPSFYPLDLTPKMDLDWENAVRKNVQLVSKEEEPKNAPVAKYVPIALAKADESIVSDLNDTPVAKADETIDSVPKDASVSKAEESNVPAKFPMGPDPRARDHPVVRYRGRKLAASEIPVLPVVIWPYLEKGIGTAEVLHVELNGVNESKYLTMADNMLAIDDPNTIWVGDTGYAYGWNFWCGAYIEWVRKAKNERLKRGLPWSWPIFIVDFTDGPTPQRCKNIEQEIGEEFVFYSTRSIVRERIFSNETNWVKLGRLMTLQLKGGRSYLHTPLVVRTDTIDSLRDVLHSHYNMTLDGPIERIDREVDVSHFWPLDGKLVGTVESRLRHLVSETIEEMGKREGLNVFVNLAGVGYRVGRRGVKSEYIDALLRSKITVCSARDSWEDHYRLFESLVTGGMVLTDRMLSLPAGLQNGTNIVEFTSQEDLRSKIRYFLSHPEERIEIARQGRFLAMLQHRSWHRLEEIIFGMRMTVCEQKDGSPCPFIVHAIEAARRRRLARKESS